MKTWVFNPHTGGVKISSAKQSEVRQRIERHAASNYAGRYIRLYPSIKNRPVWFLRNDSFGIENHKNCSVRFIT